MILNGLKDRILTNILRSSSVFQAADCGWLLEHFLLIAGTMRSLHSRLHGIVSPYFDAMTPLFMIVLLWLHHAISACAQ